jgi:hypothetical protein
MPVLPAFVGTLPGWITAGGVMTLLGIVLKVWTDNRRLSLDGRKLSMDDDTTKRGENRSDLRDCHVRLDELGKRLDQVESESHSFQLKLAGVLNAYRIVEMAHELAVPGSLAVRQARAMLRDSFKLGEVPADMNELLRDV